MKAEDETTSLIMKKLLEMSRRIAEGGGSENERQQAEAEKEQLQTQLFKAQKIEAAGALAARVAHDFSDLLRVIQEHTEKALRRVDQKDPVYQDLRRIERAVSKATNLNQQLLIFGGEQPLKLAVLDLNRTIDIVSKMLDRLLGESIAIETGLEPHLWAVRADAGSIEQVLVNLSVNAREAMPRGGKLVIKTGNITLDEKTAKAISDAQPGRFVCLTVEDTGIGMAEEISARIFEPFFTTKRPGEATGLGLAVVHGIVKHHHGYIDVHTEPGQGTAFKIYFPACAGMPEESEVAKHPASALPGKGERILLVDGDPAVREFATAALAENGYVVCEAGTAEEALEIFDKEGGGFDLLFADVVLRQKNGLQLIDQLRSGGSQLPVLFSYKGGLAKSKLAGLRRKGVQLLAKPYSVQELLEGVRTALEAEPSKGTT